LLIRSARSQSAHEVALCANDVAPRKGANKGKNPPAGGFFSFLLNFALDLLGC
jgi:hypothetical protein